MISLDLSCSFVHVCVSLSTLYTLYTLSSRPRYLNTATRISERGFWNWSVGARRYVGSRGVGVCVCVCVMTGRGRHTTLVSFCGQKQRDQEEKIKRRRRRGRGMTQPSPSRSHESSKLISSRPHPRPHSAHAFISLSYRSGSRLIIWGPGRRSKFEVRTLPMPMPGKRNLSRSRVFPAPRLVPDARHAPSRIVISFRTSLREFTCTQYPEFHPN